MKLIIHDLTKEQAEQIIPERADIRAVSDDGSIRACTGCFGCWVRTPGGCVIRDAYGGMGEALAKCEELILISRCRYGGFSPFVKNVLDRSISYILPYFTVRNREMHHRSRYENQMTMKACFYGSDVTDQEKRLAQDLVRANALNLNCRAGEVRFAARPEEFEGEIR